MILDLPRPKKPWYRRWWFTIPVYGLLILSALGTAVYFKVKAEYEAKAQLFDYAQLESMDSASLILDPKGNVVDRIFIENREPVPLESISVNLTNAVIAREDARFREHKGVDYKGVFRAAWVNWVTHSSKQGASTLTQQLARNSYPERWIRPSNPRGEWIAALPGARHPAGPGPRHPRGATAQETRE